MTATQLKPAPRKQPGGAPPRKQVQPLKDEDLTAWPQPRARLKQARTPSQRWLRVMSNIYFTFGVVMLVVGVSVLVLPARTVATAAATRQSPHAVSPVYIAALLGAGAMFLSMGQLYRNMRDIARSQRKLARKVVSSDGHAAASEVAI